MSGPTPSAVRGRDQLLVAHRGLSALYPENTLASFAAAAPLADYLELDLHPTADHQAIVVHDHTLQRTTDVASVFPDRRDDPVATFTTAELSRLDAGSWFAAEHAEARLPTLSHVGELAVTAGTGLLIEVKERDQLEVIIAAIAEVNAAWPALPLIVGSIDLVLVAELRRSLRRIPTAALFLDSTLGGSALAAVSEIAALLAFRHDVLPSGLVEAAHAQDCVIMHNTNTRTAMDWCAQLGVDATATDWASRKADALAGRAVTTIEAESLWDQAAADGPVTVRLAKEAGFKPSGGADLMAALEAGGQLSVTFDVPTPGRLDVITLDGPPPGGVLQVRVDDGAPHLVDTRTRANRRAAVNVAAPLAAGQHTLVVEVLDSPLPLLRVAVDALEISAT